MKIVASTRCQFELAVSMPAEDLRTLTPPQLAAADRSLTATALAEQDPTRRQDAAALAVLVRTCRRVTANVEPALVLPFVEWLAREGPRSFVMLLAVWEVEPDALYRLLRALVRDHPQMLWTVLSGHFLLHGDMAGELLLEHHLWRTRDPRGGGGDGSRRAGRGQPRAGEDDGRWRERLLCL